MANIVSHCFPIYSENIVPQKSLKQNLQVCAGTIHYHVLYTFIKTGLLKQLNNTRSSGHCQTTLISIFAVIVSTILILLLYPIKLAIIAVSLCLKDPKIPTASPINTFIQKLHDVCNQPLYINPGNLHIIPESSLFLKTFLIPEANTWRFHNLEEEILKLYPAIPTSWFKILSYVKSKFFRDSEIPHLHEESHDGSLYYSVMQKLTMTLKDPTISEERKRQLLEYVGSYAHACSPTWIEVIFRELVDIYNKRNSSINYVLFCVQMFKENLLQSIANRSSDEWHHIASFKHYYGQSLGLNMDALARIQFTSHLILRKQSLYTYVYKKFLSNYKASVRNLIEYTRYQISESQQELKNFLSSYLCEIMRTLQIPEDEMSTVLSSIFYDEQFELNTTGVAFILLTQGILTVEPQTTSEKITRKLSTIF
ncbi:DUF1548 domain-containing protein [Chlamydia sp. 12-01]|uniref:DUF1548 domain-containing protein n=1 Tax=Chlamydia sp. 12-01 TaxID=3002742 RepID=UPI0035D50A76